MILPSRDISGWARLQTVPFFSPNQRTTRAGGDWCEMRGRAGLDSSLPFLQSRAGRASQTSRLPRVVRWLGEKKGTALQSTDGQKQV